MTVEEFFLPFFSCISSFQFYEVKTNDRLIIRQMKFIRLEMINVFMAWEKEHNYSGLNQF